MLLKTCVGHHFITHNFTKIMKSFNTQFNPLFLCIWSIFYRWYQSSISKGLSVL